MFNRIACKLAIAAIAIALVTPAAHATQTGTDPEPTVIHHLLVLLGLS